MTCNTTSPQQYSAESASQTPNSDNPMVESHLEYWSRTPFVMWRRTLHAENPTTVRGDTEVPKMHVVLEMFRERCKAAYAPVI